MPRQRMENGELIEFTQEEEDERDLEEAGAAAEGEAELDRRAATETDVHATKAMLRMLWDLELRLRQSGWASTIPAVRGCANFEQYRARFVEEVRGQLS